MWTQPMIRAAFGAMALTFAPFGVAGAEPVQAAAAVSAVSAVDELPPEQGVSDTVVNLAGWIVATHDNQGYPFAIMDKAAAQVLVFSPDGRLRGAAPGLFGSAIGDHTIKGIAGLALRDIPAKDRTTPPGRFVGGFGPSVGGGKLLWVDYDSAVAMHPIAEVPGEKRDERLASPTPDDNRITNGCINVSPEFYETVLSPTFKAGGVFYVLPDKTPLAKVFPDFVKASSPKAAEVSAPEEEDQAAGATPSQKVAKHAQRPARENAIANP